MGIIFEYHFRIYIEIWIISNSVSTEIKRFPENMLALENLAPSENLAPPAPLRVQGPLISPPFPIFCASAFYSPFCEYIKCAYSIQISYIYFCPYQIVTEKSTLTHKNLPISGHVSLKLWLYRNYSIDLPDESID